MRWLSGRMQYMRAGQGAPAFDHSLPAVNGDVGSHPYHFLGMQETVFENGFRNDGAAIALVIKAMYCACISVG